MTNVAAEVLTLTYVIFWPEVIQQQLPNGQIVHSQQMTPHLFPNQSEFTNKLVELMKHNPDQSFEVAYVSLPSAKINIEIEDIIS